MSLIKRTLTGTVEISTAALTVTSMPPVFTGEASALDVAITFLNSGSAADISAYAAEMYLFWPERREMTDAVGMTIASNVATGTFTADLTALSGAPLLVIQLTNPDSNALVVACAQPIQITATRGEVVVTTRPPTPSEIIYIGRAPYVDPVSEEWMQWDSDAGEYVTTGYSTNKAAQEAEDAAGAIDDMTVSASAVSPGGTPTATITDVDNHKHIAFGIVTGATGATPAFTIGEVTTRPANSGATASITGTAEIPVLNLGIPQGIQGETGQTGATGAVPSLSVGTVSTGQPGSSASVTRRSGSPDTAPIFDFSIPRGDTGTAIASCVVKYQQGDSATIVPSGTWLDNPPAVPQGKYLWTRFVITQDDSPATVTTCYSVAYQGTDGSGSVSTVDSISPAAGNVQLLTIGTAPPTSSTAGSVGSRFFDKNEGCLYICTASSGGSQTWQMAGSSIEVDDQLDDDSPNPVENQVITAALAKKVEATEIVFNVAAWSNDVYWPSGNGTHPLGETANVCSRAEITQDADGNAIDCVDGDGFVATEWSQAKLPAPVWVYVDNAKIWVATRNTLTPSSQITIKGLILHRG